MNKWLKRIEEINQKYGTTLKTMQDVRAFQRKHGLVVDGKLGEKTEAKIKELYDKRKPAKGMTENNPIVLPETIVEAPKVDRRSALGKIADDFIMNDPVFGQRRQQAVAEHYDESNPFRQGNDLVANAITNAALTAMTGAGVYNLGTSLIANGARGLFPLAATIGGAYAGNEAFDSAVEGATGVPWDQHLAMAGMDEYGRTLFKPGAWAGSYGAGKLTNGVLTGAQNARAWFENNMPRMAVTPEGVVEVAPGQQVTLTGRPVSYQQASQGNTGYQGRYTTKTGGSRGSSAGQNGRVQSGQSYGQASRGVQERVMGSTGKVKDGSASMTFTNPFTPYTPPSPWSGWLPWGGTTYVPPTAPPPEEPPVVAPKPETRLEEYRPYNDPFLKWYALQPEGTTQYYPGDQVHKAGPYVIIRTKADPKSTVRLVGDSQGWVVPDSTSIRYNVAIPPQVNELPGGVPAEAERSKEKITGYRRGGKLIRK